MPLNEFLIGKRLRTTWTILQNGATVDPPAVVFVVQRPDLQEYVSGFGQSGTPTYPITQQSQGVYYADIPLIVVAKDATLERPRWAYTWLAYDENGSPLDTAQRVLWPRESLLATPLPANPS